jgi:hypothetical protein
MRIYNLNWHLKENDQSNKAHSKFFLLNDQNQSPLQIPILHNIGNLINAQIMPNGVYNIQMHLYHNVNIKFNLSIEKNSDIAVFIEKNELPTLTKFKYFEKFDSQNLPSSKINKNSNKIQRSSSSSRTVGDSAILMANTAFIHYLEEGVWFVSLLNDNKYPIQFQLKTEYYGKFLKFIFHIFYNNFIIQNYY